MATDPRSPFNWRNRTEPSIFAQDPYFRARSSGKTLGQMMGESASNHLKTKHINGKPAPVVYGLGDKPKKRAEDILQYRVFGVYSRAKSSVKPSKNKYEK